MLVCLFHRVTTEFTTKRSFFIQRFTNSTLSCDSFGDPRVFTLKHPRSDFQFSPLASTHSLVNWLQEFGDQQFLPLEVLEYSHNLFARK